MIHLVEIRNIPISTDRGAPKEDGYYHYKDGALGRRARSTLIDCGRHTQEYATNAA